MENPESPRDPSRCYHRRDQMPVWSEARFNIGSQTAVKRSAKTRPGGAGAKTSEMLARVNEKLVTEIEGCTTVPLCDATATTPGFSRWLHSRPSARLHRVTRGRPRDPHDRCNSFARAVVIQEKLPKGTDGLTSRRETSDQDDA
jgi:hypothetical protein